MLCSGTSDALSAWVIESPSKLPDTIFVPMTDVGVMGWSPKAEMVDLQCIQDELVTIISSGPACP